MSMRIVPANDARCGDLQAVFGTRDAAAYCRCRRYKLRTREAFELFPAAERAARLRAQTRCGRPEGEATNRGRGSAHALVAEAVGHARRGGARALEGYPLLTEPGQRIAWDEIHVGTRAMFAAAGLAEVSRPSTRRVVMRVDFPA
ncbi:MAG TPA: hypothetical protein VFU51_12600 [Gaiellaceae bacterium]|nr:hypothetical protein [Gaiellaceae bacterium]